MAGDYGPIGSGGPPRHREHRAGKKERVSFPVGTAGIPGFRIASPDWRYPHSSMGRIIPPFSPFSSVMNWRFIGWPPSIQYAVIGFEEPREVEREKLYRRALLLHPGKWRGDAGRTGRALGNHPLEGKEPQTGGRRGKAGKESGIRSSRRGAETQRTGKRGRRKLSVASCQFGIGRA